MNNVFQRDCQGSLTATVHGDTVERLSYDPWDRRRNTTNFAQTQTVFTFDRGFTGHEHYDNLKIINANARLYDPVIGRFFSPDPFVQAPDFTQNYNRYSYCLNNPVMYSDPDGEFVGAVLGFVSDLFSNLFIKPFTGEDDDWDQTVHGWEIDMGLLHTDPNKSFLGQTWELFSRFTWQAPQTSTGHLFVSVAIQSQQHGPLYFGSVAVPSLQSAILHPTINHRERWFEADASYKGSAYFDKYYGSGKENYEANNPIYFQKENFSTVHPISGTFHWTDIPIIATPFALFAIMLFL